MVEKENAKTFCKVFQFGSSGNVCLAGCQIARRMIVCDDDFLRTGLQRLAENCTFGKATRNIAAACAVVSTTTL